MDNNSFYNWKLNIRPDSLQMDVAGFWECDSLAALASKGRTRHQAFAIGFFGFHHIRADVENEPSLRRDSLRILKQLLITYEIETILLKKLNTRKKWSYPDYWENVLKQISLELGDSLGLETQRTVELGYWLAAAHSCLVGFSQDDNSEEIRGGLKILQSWIAALLVLAQQAGIPETLLKPLAELAHLLRRPKTNHTTFRCIQMIKSVLENFLLSKATAQPWGEVN